MAEKTRVWEQDCGCKGIVGGEEQGRGESLWSGQGPRATAKGWFRPSGRRRRAWTVPPR